MKCFVNRCFSTSVILILMILAVINMAYVNENRMLTEGISQKIIRFHVRANSDSDEDQAVKLLVRDGILEYLAGVMPEDADINESRDTLCMNISSVEQTAKKVLMQNGFDYEVKAYMTHEYFPTRKYGDIVLPPGEYEAFRVDIGQAQGRNWWCVMYPAMCFVETTHAIADDEVEIRNILTEKEYEYITGCKLEFKYLKFLNYDGLQK